MSFEAESSVCDRSCKSEKGILMWLRLLSMNLIDTVIAILYGFGVCQLLPDLFKILDLPQFHNVR